MSVDPRFPDYVELVDPATHLPYRAGSGGSAVSILDENSDPITAANPFPVAGTVSISNFPATQPVSGTVAVTQATSPWVVSGSGVFNVRPASPSPSDYLPVRLTNGTAFYSASGGGGGSDVQYMEGDTAAAPTGTVAMWRSAGDAIVSVSAANPLPVVVSGTATVDQGTTPWVVDGSGFTQPVFGTVAVSNFPATQPVSGTVTANQGTSPWVVGDGGGSITVDGPLTDTQLRATAVPVSGPLTDVQLRATAVPVSGPLTDAQLRATPVPVSGTVTATGPLTDTQLRATPVPISGTVAVSGTVAATQSGTWNVGLSTGSNTVGKVDQGAAGAAAWLVDGSGVTQPISGSVTVSGTVAATQSGAWTVTANQGTSPWVVGDGGGSLTVDGPLTDAQLRATPVPISGTVTITDGSGPVTVDGTVAATQSGTWNVGLSTGTNSIGDVRSITTSVTPGTGATHLGKAEDAAHASGDVGVMPLAVRRDADTSLVDLDGDYAPVQVNATGAVKTVLSDRVITGTVTSTSSAGWVMLPVAGMSTATVEVIGTWTGTLSFTGIGRGATYFTNLLGENLSTGLREGVTSANGMWIFNVAGFSEFWITVPVWTSGTATVAVQASSGVRPLQSTEDAAHTSGDPGVMALAVYQNARVNMVSTNGDYAPLQVNTFGELRVGAGDDLTTSSTLLTVGDELTFPLEGRGTATLVVSGDFTGELAIKATADVGSSYFDVPAFSWVNGAYTDTIVGPDTLTLDVASYSHLRVVATSFRGGIAAVYMRAGVATPEPPLPAFGPLSVDGSGVIQPVEDYGTRSELENITDLLTEIRDFLEGV